MATWTTNASDEIRSFSQRGLSDAEVNQLRSDVGKWADMIGKFNRKKFKVGIYTVEAAAENHEVQSLTMDM